MFQSIFTVISGGTTAYNKWKCDESTIPLCKIFNKSFLIVKAVAGSKFALKVAEPSSVINNSPCFKTKIIKKVF